MTRGRHLDMLDSSPHRCGCLSGQTESQGRLVGNAGQRGRIQAPPSLFQFECPRPVRLEVVLDRPGLNADLEYTRCCLAPLNGILAFPLLILVNRHDGELLSLSLRVDDALRFYPCVTVAVWGYGRQLRLCSECIY